MPLWLFCVKQAANMAVLFVRVVIYDLNIISKLW